MAQLPPKIPSIPQNWPSFAHHKMSAMANFDPTNTTQQQQYHHQQQQQQQNSSPPLSQQLPSWVDEFLDFSSARRGAHRRSASDSIAFLEECRSSGTVAGAHGFDRLDEEQLMSLFSDDIASSGFPPALSNPSTPSDQNSNNDEKPMVLDELVPVKENQKQPPPKNSEQGEVESSCKNETASPPSSVAPSSVETTADPKRVKRILANRQSAQRSRVRKLQYISDLEKSVTTLQTEVSALSPRVAFLDHQRLVLNVNNSALKQRIAALAQDKIFKDAHQEALKKEIERLRQVYEQQKLLKRGNSVNNNNNMNGNSLPFASVEKEQLLS
ncbi:basic leucine zipper 61 [Neltuma alba]|uniref:basic leucine zipper 61 n=1 Tax=Neltuma alba TaxID=207710 RepID=UPI0010A4734F|nr:basic leucine zipper 61-like [Prosopis alba]